MAINFPNDPALDQIYTQGSAKWKWNGFAWDVLPEGSPSFENVTADSVSTGALTVSGTSNVADINVTGTITGVALNDISDVTSVTPQDGAKLTWHETTQDWRPLIDVTTGFNGGTITNPLVINNNNATTGADSGALRVTGGVGIGDDLYVDDNVTVNGTLFSTDLQVRSSGELKLYNPSNNRYVGFSAPDNISTDRVYTLPGSDGASGQFLRTNGSGTLTWASVTSPSGGTPPGGVDTYVQFNDALEFGGDAGFTYDYNTQTATLGNLSVGTTNVTGNTNSDSVSNGALVVTGGVGIGANITVGGLARFTDATQSTSTTTGAIIVTGGIGIGGDVNVGNNVTASSAPTQSDHLTNKEYVDATAVAFAVAFGA